jgi:uncharacterized protein YbaR (Trm112 family)
MMTPRELKALYEQRQSITEHLRREKGTDGNTEAIIEIAYDLQTGSYIAALDDPKAAKEQAAYAEEVARTIQGLCTPSSVLEAGVGEATTFAGVLGRLGGGVAGYGFDLSWSRVAYARRFLAGHGLNGVTLCTASLLQMPYADDSIDVVYTSHSIEPNRGREEPILRELFRVAGRYLILLEPAYELASAAARQRMDSHGYCRDLPGVARSLGYEVVQHQLFACNSSPLNPTAVTIIKKNTVHQPPSHVLACPKFKTPLRQVAGMFFSEEALVVYPVVAGIPCLRTENGIVASKYEEVAAFAQVVGATSP